MHTEGRKCSYGNINIKKDKTIFLFNLSIELLKLYTPVILIEFLDNSYFNCKLPDNSNVKIFLSHYYFIFHNGHTWYDDKFGAYPLDIEQKKYMNLFQIILIIQNTSAPSRACPGCGVDGSCERL